jgi:hypothetical protein
MNASGLQVRRAYEAHFGQPMPGKLTFQGAANVLMTQLGEKKAQELVASMSNDPKITTDMERFSLIFVEVSQPKRVHRNYQFTATFKERPLPRDVVIAQIVAGYDPAGYGGPCLEKEELEPSGEQWIVTFHCSDNCD